MRGEGRRVDLVNAAPGPRALMAAVWQADAAEARGTLPHPCPTPILDMVERVGRATVASLCEARDLLNFLGLLAVTLGRSLLRPRRLRLTAIFFHMEQAGLNALPIVGLLSFLIGVVLAYQGADQLRQFGAQIYAVNLLGISILREIGVLMTAIIVAGRSGS